MFGLSATDNKLVDPNIVANQLGNLMDAFRGGNMPDFTGQTGKTGGTDITDLSTNVALPEVATGTATGASSETGGTYSDDFYAKILTGIGAPVTPENLRLMHAWTQAEGMDPSRNNPFATTQGAAGSSDINSVGVKSYPDAQTGIDATIQTLLNGNYANIVSGLKSGTDAMAVADAIAASPWGTGGLVSKVLGG
jgi:hypothetical protein